MSKYASSGADWISFLRLVQLGLMSQWLVPSGGFKVTPAGVPDEGVLSH